MRLNYYSIDKTSNMNEIAQKNHLHKIFKGIN